jgi:hypothetical protein
MLGRFSLVAIILDEIINLVFVEFAGVEFLETRSYCCILWEFTKAILLFYTLIIIDELIVRIVIIVISLFLLFAFLLADFAWLLDIALFD